MRIKLELTQSQRTELEVMLKKSTKAYLRERAAAILKIADGAFGNEVAARGLLRHRRKNTVYDWVLRYKNAGIAGLAISAGRGRKPSFSPSDKGGAETIPATDLGTKP